MDRKLEQNFERNIIDELENTAFKLLMYKSCTVVHFMTACAIYQILA